MSTVESKEGTAGNSFTSNDEVVMFIDMVGACELKNTHTAYGVGADLVHQHNERVVELLRGGQWAGSLPDGFDLEPNAVRVIKLVGDGVMVLLDGDRGAQAALIGVFLLEALDQERRRREEHDGQRIPGTCVGIAAGPVLHASPEAPPDLHNHFGRPVDIAARLANLPAPSHVLLDESVYASLRGDPHVQHEIAEAGRTWAGPVQLQSLLGTTTPVQFMALIRTDLGFDLPMSWLRAQGLVLLQRKLADLLVTLETARSPIKAARDMDSVSYAHRELDTVRETGFAWRSTIPGDTAYPVTEDELLHRTVLSLSEDTQALLRQAFESLNGFIDEIWTSKSPALMARSQNQRNSVALEILNDLDKHLVPITKAYDAVCEASVAEAMQRA